LADAFPGPGKPPDPSLPLLCVYMFNKQEGQRVVLVEEMKVNGLEVFNGFQSFLGGNKREYATLYLDRQAYQEHNFESNRELSVCFQIQVEDFSKGPLYSTETVFFDFEEDVPQLAG